MPKKKKEEETFITPFIITILNIGQIKALAIVMTSMRIKMKNSEIYKNATHMPILNHQ